MRLVNNSSPWLFYLHLNVILSYLILWRITNGLMVPLGIVLISRAVVEVEVLRLVLLVDTEVLDVLVVKDWVVDVEELVDEVLKLVEVELDVLLVDIDVL